MSAVVVVVLLVNH